jgi:phosphoglycolate phosphatase
MLLAACSQLGVQPPNLLHVGDSPADISAARRASCRVVAVIYGYGDYDALAAARPDGILGDLAKIAAISDADRSSPAALRA